MKKIFKFGFVAVFVAALIGFISCKNEDESHTHTFSTELTGDNTYHWYPTTCGHTVVFGKVKHIFGEPSIENGIVTKKCYVCQKIVSGPVLKGYSFENDFQNALKETKAVIMSRDSYNNEIDSNVNKIVFCLRSNSAIKAEISSLESKKVNIGVNEGTCYAYFNATDGIVYIVPTDEKATIFVFNENSNEIFSGYNKCTEIVGLDLIDTSKVINMRHMFNYCESLITLDVSNFDTSNVTDISGMFHNCSTLTTLDVSNFDTSNVTNMRDMFSKCMSLTTIDVSNFDTSNVTNMGYMFNECYSVVMLDLSNFDTSNVTTMADMFFHCRALTALDVSSFDTSKVTGMGSMFNSCRALKSLDISNFDTSKVKSMGWMFNYCIALNSLDISNFDTSNVTNMNSMFYGCSNLETIYVKNKGTFIPSGCSTDNMFNNCKTQELTTKTN